MSVITPVRILGIGVSLPSLRLSVADIAAAWGDAAGKGSVPVCADDEDVLTLAWEAGERAIAAAGLSPAEVDGLWWGTARPPFAEGPSHATLATALRLPNTAGGALTAGSAHAGIEALLGAWDAVAAGSVRNALVVMADSVLPGLGTSYERRAGAAAVAVVVAKEGGSAALTARVTRSEPVLDRYRGDRERETREVYDARLFREQTFVPVIRETAGGLGSEVASWSLPDPDGRLASTVARKIGGHLASADVSKLVGDSGAAAPLLGAVGALSHEGVVGVVGYGGGRVTAVAIAVESPVPGAGDPAQLLTGGRSATYAEVLRARGQLVATGETVPMGIPPGSAGFVRGGREMLQLLGARCVDCGVVNTPPSIHPHCIGCGGAKFEEVELARRGVVHTFVINHAMPAPFVAPLPLAVIDLEDGARVMLQLTDGPSAAPTLEIGDKVTLVLRRYAYERGAPVYGYKALKVSAS